MRAAIAIGIGVVASVFRVSGGGVLRATMDTKKKRAQTSLSVRFDDRRGLNCRFNKTGLKSPLKKKLYSYFFKLYEQWGRGGDGSAVQKKFGTLRAVSARFPPLTPLPDGFQLLDEEKKKAAVMKLVDAQVEAAAVIINAVET